MEISNCICRLRGGGLRLQDRVLRTVDWRRTKPIESAKDRRVSGSIKWFRNASSRHHFPINSGCLGAEKIRCRDHWRTILLTISMRSWRLCPTSSTPRPPAPHVEISTTSLCVGYAKTTRSKWSNYTPTQVCEKPARRTHDNEEIVTGRSLLESEQEKGRTQESGQGTQKGEGEFEEEVVSSGSGV